MFKITNVFRECINIFKKEMKEIEVYNEIKVKVPVTTKYIVVNSTGIMCAFDNKPEFKGRWKAGKEYPTPIAIVEIEGDYKDSLIKI